MAYDQRYSPYPQQMYNPYMSMSNQYSVPMQPMVASQVASIPAPPSPEEKECSSPLEFLSPVA